MRLLVMVLALMIPAGASADVLGRGGKLSEKFGVLDRRGAAQYRGSERLRPKVELPPEIASRRASPEAALPRFTGRYAGPYLGMAKLAARKHSVPEDLFLRLVQRESGWNARALSHKGAIGLAQLMPGTAQRLKVNPHDPEENLDGGARYLRRQFDRFGDWRLALAAYNAGPGAVEKHGGVPPYRETTAYVAWIMGK